MNFLVGIYLIVEGIRDFRTKTISSWCCIAFFILGILYSILEGREWEEFILAIIPGLIFLGFSFLTQEMMGYGDGLIICCLGLIYPFNDILCIILVATIAACVAGLVLLAVFQKNGKYEMPFVPFLFVGWVFFQGLRIMNGGIL